MERIKERPKWFIDALEADHQNGFVDVSGAKVHFMEWGDASNPSVIMLHGNHAHAYWFQFIGALLSKKYHFVVMSFSGMGDSDWRSYYERDTFVKDVWGVVEARRLNNPVVVGHSFGGMVALITAGYHSSDMSGLLLVDYIVNPPEKHIEWYEGWPKSKPPKIHDSKEKLMKRFRLMPPQECKNQYLLDFISEKSIRKTEDGWSWTFDPTTYDNLVIGNDHNEIIEKINCPVGFYYGEKSIEFDVGSSIKQMKEILPEGSPMFGLEDAQHHLMLDRPRTFSKHLDILIQELIGLS